MGRPWAVLAVVLALAGAGPAPASDRCLEGASVLGDQRALAALRVATEAACPCDTFGVPGRGRTAYQRCARRVLKDAVHAAQIRRRCKRTAGAVIRGASCGTDRLPCGRFRAAARRPVRCRLKKASQCREARDEHACAVETHCADVIDWTAGTCIDPRENGPFAVGVRTIRVTRTSTFTTYCRGGAGSCATAPFGENCLCTGNADCVSGVCVAERALDTVVWYPAPPGAGPVDPAVGGVRDAPLAADAPFPLLMFSHGSCGYPLQSLFLTPLLASHGFVVAAPPHPPNTVFQFPTCGTPNVLLTSAVERPADVRFVVDELLALGADTSSPLFGAIDPSRIGMSGHSFGGFTTYLAVADDSRYRVAVPLAPAVPPAPGLAVPSLTMLGQIDSVVNVPAIRGAFAAAQEPKFLVEVEHAGHYAFSDLCFPSADCNPPTTLTQTEAHDAVLRWVLPFLQVYLAGDAEFQPLLSAPPPPGVLVVTP